MASEKEWLEAASSERQYRDACFLQPLNFQKFTTLQKIRLLEEFNIELLKKYCSMVGAIPPFPMVPQKSSRKADEELHNRLFIKEESSKQSVPGARARVNVEVVLARAPTKKRVDKLVAKRPELIHRKVDSECAIDSSLPADFFSEADSGSEELPLKPGAKRDYEKYVFR